MTAAQLRLLVVFALEFVADAVEQLHVALLRVALERRHERVRHGACGGSGDVGVGSVSGNGGLVIEVLDELDRIVEAIAARNARSKRAL